MLIALLGGVGLVLLVMGLRRKPSGGPTLPVELRNGVIKLGNDLQSHIGGGSRKGRRKQDLAVTGRSAEALALKVGTSAIVGALAPPAVVVGLHFVGIGLSPLAGAVGAVFGISIGIASPLLSLHDAAAKKRAAFRQGLSCWLQLVVLAQAGGMGVESALEAASRVSSDATFLALRRAVARARHAGSTPWDSLGRLGGELGIEELEELAANLGLAGTEGARVRASLAAKSLAIRRKQTNEAHAAANATTERLFLPSVVLMFGFLVFLMYPAGVSLTRVL